MKKEQIQIDTEFIRFDSLLKLSGGAITGGQATISGRFSDEEIKSIADALVSGSFPFQIKIDAVFDTDPKLGAANVANGIWVGVFSLLFVAAFMCIYYRLAGVIAVCALGLNIVLVLGAMAAFNATLTLGLEK